MDCKPYGDRGILLSGANHAERAALLAGLDRSLPQGCSEFVSGYDTILFKDAGREAVDEWLESLPDAAEGQARRPRLHTIPVNYDGADLETVAKICGMKVDEVIACHSAPIYTVRMMGFSPGFPYLDGLDPKLHLPRRASPRDRIAPGSVAIGGGHAGIYSVASPGGWHILGRTKRALFDLNASQKAEPDEDSVFALKVGDQVRFNLAKD